MSDRPRRRDLCLTTHNTHKAQTSVSPAGYKPAITANELRQTNAVDRAATGISFRVSKGTIYGLTISLNTDPTEKFLSNWGVISLLTFKNSTWCSLCGECFVRISEQTATFALYIIDWLVFVTVVESVYCAVRIDSLHKADYVSSLKGLTFKNSTWHLICVECFVRISEQTATFVLYIINWLVFVTVVESVYCAVRTDSLYKADYISSLKG